MYNHLYGYGQLPHNQQQSPPSYHNNQQHYSPTSPVTYQQHQHQHAPPPPPPPYHRPAEDHDRHYVPYSPAQHQHPPASGPMPLPNYGYMSQPNAGLQQIPMPLKGPYDHERHRLSSERSNNNRISDEAHKQARIMSNLSRETYSNDGFNSIGTAAYDPYNNNATTISSIVHSPTMSVHNLPTTLPPLNSTMMNAKPENSRSDPRTGLPYDVREQTPSLREPQPPPPPNLVVGELSPYGCDVPGCYASFPASSGLFYHMKTTHPNLDGVEKPYRCAMPNCTKRYKNINGLQYHLREAKGTSGHPALTAAATAAAASANGGEEEKMQKSFKCQAAGCKKAYRTQNGLRYHQSHVHSIPSSSDLRNANVRATWQ